MKPLSKCLSLVLALLICLSLLPIGALAEETAAEAFAPDGAGANLQQITITGTYQQSQARSMLHMINAFRTGSDAWYWNSDNATKTQYNTSGNSSLRTLSYDYALEQIAMQRAKEIAIYYSHTRPTGENCFTATYNGTHSWGENIAMGTSWYYTTERVFNAWREDNDAYSGQGHRRNMLNSSYTAVGIGCFVFDGYTFWVQEFGYATNTPAAPANDSTEAVTMEYSTAMISSWNGLPGVISFNSNGGTVSTAVKTVTCGGTYGTLPTPTRSGYTFAGWYTAAAGGSKVTSGTTVAAAGDHTLYAHWQTNQTATDGLVRTASGWQYLKNGVLDTSFTGLARNDYGWWYVKNGRIDFTYTGMAKNAYGWWYVKKGKLDLTYTGMAKNAYGWWYMKNGRLDTSYTGMAKNAYGWWYMKNGRLDTTYTGIAKNAYGTWFMINGRLAASYTGTVTYNGRTYSVVNGKAILQ